MMDVFGKMGKTNSKGKMTIFVFFLLMSFSIQTSLPRVSSIHHAHKGGQSEHQHTEIQFKSATEHHHDEAGQHGHAHQTPDTHHPKRVDAKGDETRIRSASLNIGHDHHKHFFLGKFVSETPLQQDPFSFQWLESHEHQNQRPAHRIGTHIRGPPFSIT